MYNHHFCIQIIYFIWKLKNKQFNVKAQKADTKSSVSLETNAQICIGCHIDANCKVYKKTKNHNKK